MASKKKVSTKTKKTQVVEEQLEEMDVGEVLGNQTTDTQSSNEDIIPPLLPTDPPKNLNFNIGDVYSFINEYGGKSFWLCADLYYDKLNNTLVPLGIISRRTHDYPEYMNRVQIEDFNFYYSASNLKRIDQFNSPEFVANYINHMNKFFDVMEECKYYDLYKRTVNKDNIVGGWVLGGVYSKDTDLGKEYIISLHRYGQFIGVLRNNIHGILIGSMYPSQDLVDALGNGSLIFEGMLSYNYYKMALRLFDNNITIKLPEDINSILMKLI